MPAAPGEAAGRIQRLEALGPQAAPRDALVISGLTIPGLCNGHSHAFHRALRGRTEEPGLPAGTFWSWRDQMYRLASRLDPASYHRLARAVYGEMALAEITAVGEFHYLHHHRDGAPYPRPEMEEALVVAASEAGIRLTLLDTCYLRPGFDGGPLESAAVRFSDSDPASWARPLAVRQPRSPQGGQVSPSAYGLQSGT